MHILEKENGHVRFYLDEVVKLSGLFKVPIENFFEAGCHIKTHTLEDTSLEVR